MFIVWLSELFRDEASNSLLKALEEPSPNTVFILVTHDLEAQLGTIVSRTQKLILPRIPEQEIAKYLVRTHEMDQDLAKKAAHLSEGNIPEALHLAGEKNRVDFSAVQRWMQLCWTNKIDGLSEEADKFGGESKDVQKTIFQVALKTLQNSVHAKYEKEENYWPEELQSFFRKLMEALNPEKIDAIRKELEEAIWLIDRNMNPKILFFAKSQRINQILRS